MDGVSIHPVTTKIYASFLTQLPERNETVQGFHHEANGDYKTITSLMAVKGENWMDQQHCSYNTNLIDRVKRRKTVQNKNI